jgi:hypothetical protein
MVDMKMRQENNVQLLDPMLREVGGRRPTTGTFIVGEAMFILVWGACVDKHGEDILRLLHLLQQDRITVTDVYESNSQHIAPDRCKGEI